MVDCGAHDECTIRVGGYEVLSHSRLDSAKAEAPSPPGGDGRESDLRLRLQSRILSASLHESRGSLVAILGYARLLLEGGILADSPEERE